MSNQLQNKLRKKFQPEQVLFFYDAAFAIAITLKTPTCNK